MPTNEVSNSGVSVTDTPTGNSPQQYPPAGLLRRLAAMIYDSLLLMGISLCYGALAVAFEKMVLGFDVESGSATPGTGFQIGWVVVIIVFFTFFWRRGGQTLGMRSWRVQVLNKDGSYLTITQCLMRCCLAPLSLGLAGIGYLWCVWDKEGQTLHDKFSRSCVIVLPKVKKEKLGFK